MFLALPAAAQSVPAGPPMPLEVREPAAPVRDTRPLVRAQPRTDKQQESAATESVALGGAPTKTASAEWIPRTFTALAGVVGLILVLAGGFKWISRKNPSLLAAMGAGGRAPSGILNVLGRYPISRGTTLVLLKVDRRILLLCQTARGKMSAGSMTTLTEITDPEEVASIVLKSGDAAGETISRKFQDMLSRSEAEGEVGEEPVAPRREVQAPAIARPERSRTLGIPTREAARTSVKPVPASTSNMRLASNSRIEAKPAPRASSSPASSAASRAAQQAAAAQALRQRLASMQAGSKAA
jgi:flagellar biogenesis protein FliO